jgi:glycosyltransferase involved in cell wall biosynthesis
MESNSLNVTSSKPAILIIDNSTGATGAFKSIWAMTRALDSQFDFHYALPETSSVAQVVKASGKPLLPLPFLEIRKHASVLIYFPVLVSNTWRIRNYCLRHQVRLVHVNDIYNLTGVLLKWFSPNIRLVYHVRLLPSSYVGAMFKVWRFLVTRSAHSVIAVSGAVRQALLPTIDKKIVVIYDFVDVRPPDTRKNSGQEPLFLYPANYVAGKGHRFALQAFHALHRTGLNARLRFVGGDLGLPQNRRIRKELEDDVRAFGLSNCVTVAGVELSMEEAMTRADIVLNFSESESFSMVCYEAAMLGRPVISTDCGGPVELIENGITGLLVRNRDVNEMTQAMILLVEDGMLRQRLGDQASQRMKARVQAHASADRLAEVYRRLTV